jgi:hypothetical protein
MKITAICRRYLLLAELSLAGAMFLAGCSSEPPAIRADEAVAPKPPAFLIGPAGVLLTNAGSYSARLTVDSPDPTNKLPALTGHLLAQGGHLLFAPDQGDKTFIWDVPQHNGYVLSESLQGYAPVASELQITGVLTTSQIAGAASDRVNGQAGHEAEISISLNDGSTARFTVWRAANFGDLPVRVKSLTASTPFELNLSEVRRETFAPGLFQPPDGFAKYGSPELMNTELLARKSKLRHPGINNNASDEPALPQHKNL